MLKQNVFSSQTHKKTAQMVWLIVLTWFKLIFVFNVRGSTWEMWVANLCSEYKMIQIAKFQHLELRPWVQSKRKNFELNTAGEGEHQSIPQMLNFESPWNKVPFFCAELFTGTGCRKAAASFNISTVLWKIQIKRIVRNDCPFHSLTVLEQSQCVCNKLQMWQATQ